MMGPDSKHNREKPRHLAAASPPHPRPDVFGHPGVRGGRWRLTPGTCPKPRLQPRSRALRRPAWSAGASGITRTSGFCRINRTCTFREPKTQTAFPLRSRCRVSRSRPTGPACRPEQDRPAALGSRWRVRSERPLCLGAVPNEAVGPGRCSWVPPQSRSADASSEGRAQRLHAHAALALSQGGRTDLVHIGTALLSPGFVAVGRSVGRPPTTATGEGERARGDARPRQMRPRAATAGQRAPQAEATGGCRHLCPEEPGHPQPRSVMARRTPALTGRNTVSSPPGRPTRPGPTQGATPPA